MAERYTRETFSMDVIPSGFLKETRDLVKEAVNDYAWTLSVKGMTMALHAPDESEKRIPFSASNRREPIQAHRRTIRKHGFKRNKTAIRAAVERAIDKKQEPAVPYVVDVGPMIATHGGKGAKVVKYESHTANQRTWSDGRIDFICSVEGCGYTGDKKASMGSHYRRHVLRGEVERVDEKSRQARRVGKTPNPDRTLVSVGPMMSRRSGKDGDEYESVVAKKRTWSDDSVDYICSIEGCGFVGDVPLSMSSHWRKHTASGEAEKAPPRGDEARPPEEKTQALAVVLQKRLEDGTLNWSDPAAAALSLAEESLSWVRLHLMHPRVAGSEPADEIIEQIRVLVGGADKGEVEALNEKVSELQSKVEEVKADRDRVKGNMHALRELLTDSDEEQAS